MNPVRHYIKRPVNQNMKTTITEKKSVDYLGGLTG